MSISRKWKTGYERLARTIATCLPDSEEAVFLELGCGKGQLTLPLARALAAKLKAVDRSEEEVKALRRRLAQARLDGKVECWVKGIEELELPGSSISGAVSNFLLGWLSEQEMLGMMRRCLHWIEDTGVMVHSDLLPIAESPAQEIALEQASALNNTLPSVKLWTPDEVVDLAERAGFSQASVRYFDWRLSFSYEEAVEQLRRWHAKPEFIESRRMELREHGMEMPRSFIVSAVR